ncbi:MAG: ATP-binding protein, partial [Deltaproteobacteria bacterium]|nr:ATP-binding protein [Deltaproteobacteria bacterium]
MVTDSKILELQNPWWQNASLILADQHILEIKDKSYRYEPAILGKIALNKGDINIIRGPRQVGKTTTLKLIIKKILAEESEPSSIVYLSCESFDSWKELQQVLLQYLKSMPATKQLYIFLDEISFIPSWQRAVLALANMGLLRNSAVVLTGSNARDLKESGERLPGRRGKGKDYKLYPLSITELGNLQCFQNKSPKEMLELYMLIGGFPRAIADFVAFGSVTDSTYETYRNWIAGDAQRYELRQETLKQILYRISETLASRITWPILIENSPVKSHETALQYVEHLQDAFLCTIHYCYNEETKGPSFQKARKLYFIDPLLFTIAATWRDGMPNMFEWMKLQLKEPAFTGKLFESVVVNHISRKYGQAYYWYSTKHKKE